MMHRGTRSTKSHLVVDRIYPKHSWPRNIAACGEYDVIVGDPANARLSFMCRKCLAKIGKSIERMVTA